LSVVQLSGTGTGCRCRTPFAAPQSADWLAKQGLGVDEVSEASVQDRIEVLERLRVLD
jgi:hypothetical protein